MQNLLLTTSAVANIYFWLQVLVFKLRVQHVLVGVLTELLTIPCILALLVTFVLLTVTLFSGRVGGRRRWLTVGLLVSSLVLILFAFVS